MSEEQNLFLKGLSQKFSQEETLKKVQRSVTSEVKVDTTTQAQKEFLVSLTTKRIETENGSPTNNSTGSALVDQFGIMGTARGRDIQTVFTEQSQIWAENPLAALRFTYYLRMITRNVKGYENWESSGKVQKGQGSRDEAFKRLLWIAWNKKDTFEKNLIYLPLVGSWKDLWQLLLMDKGNFINKTKVYELLKLGLEDAVQSENVKKYMPTIYSDAGLNKKCKNGKPLHSKELNDLANGFRKYLKLNEKEYRKLKSSGKSHEFQRLLVSKNYKELNFGRIPSKAMFNIVKKDFLTKHNLEDKFESWLDTQSTVKFNGYPYELVKAVRSAGGSYKLSRIKKHTFDKQFENLIQLGKKDGCPLKGNVWVLLDTSGSMDNKIPDSEITCSDIANGLGLYFATLNEGAFHKKVLGFDSTSHLFQLGGTFTEMLNHLPNVGCGGTNFDGAIDEIIDLRKSELGKSIPLEDYPTILIAISDMQFNYSVYGDSSKGETNYEKLKQKFARHFPQEWCDKLQFIWWQVNARDKVYPSTIADKGTYFISGFDGAVISILLGGEQKVNEKGEIVLKTSEELVEEVLNQDILKSLQL